MTHIRNKLRARVIAVVDDTFVTITKDWRKDTPPRTTFPGRFIYDLAYADEEAVRSFEEQTGIQIYPNEIHPTTVPVRVGHRTYLVFVIKLSRARFDNARLKRGVRTRSRPKLRSMSLRGEDVSTTLQVLDALEQYVSPQVARDGTCSNGHPGIIDSVCTSHECGGVIMNTH